MLQCSEYYLLHQLFKLVLVLRQSSASSESQWTTNRKPTVVSPMVTWPQRSRSWRLQKLRCNVSVT